MNTTFEELLDDTVKNDMIHFLEPSLNEWEESVNEINLNSSGISKLAKLIEGLPQKGQEIMLGVYAFDLTPENIEVLYGISEVDLRRKFFEKMLARDMGLNNGERISKTAISKACHKVMIGLEKKDSSDNKVSNVISIFIRTAAAILIIGILSFGTAMGVNAEFRESVSKWFIETFSEYSIFRLENDNAVNTDLSDYTISYVPDRFSYTRVEKYDDIISFTYEDIEGNYLSIDIERPGENDYVDTENTSMELLDFNGAEARYYYKEDYSLLVTSIDGYALYVTGPVSKEEILKIAYGIQR